MIWLDGCLSKVRTKLGGSGATSWQHHGEHDWKPAFVRVSGRRFLWGFRYERVHRALTFPCIPCADGTESLDHSRSNGAEARR
jgi:hypothetical protein